MSIDVVRQKYFPFSPVDGIVIRSVDAEAAYKITGTIADRVASSQDDLGLLPQTPTPVLLKESFRSHTEYFGIYDSENEPIGWSIGQQRESDTFIMQWTGILLEFQGRGIYSGFLRHLLAYLKEIGYARVTSNHFVNNRAVLIAKLKAGFVASGMTLDERWGATLWLTMFLDRNAETTFQNAFSLIDYDKV